MKPDALPRQIGITGGIGSGKSTVCRLFETLGVPVYYADDRAKRLMQEDALLRSAIAERFGPEVYATDGSLRRAELATLVFGDPEALADLNALVHPAVFRDAAAWSEAQRGHPYVLREAALLFESGSWRLVDEVVVVWAPEALRVHRVMARDGVTEAEVRARMDRQWPDEEKRRRADHVITNDGSVPLIPQVWALHRRFAGLPGREGASTRPR
jgi:dephospho-CoA kinase